MMSRESAERHLFILGTLYIALGALGLLAAVGLFVAIVSAGVLSGDAQAEAVTSIVGTAIAAFFTLLSLPGIVTGVGLLQHRPWAKVLVLVLGFLNLFNFPAGTALGVYTLWFVMQPEVDQLFPSRRQLPAGPSDTPHHMAPPPPSNPL
jgi:hypothetical protein